MPLRFGFYDPGKIGYGLMHALMRDHPALSTVAFIKAEHRHAPPLGPPASRVLLHSRPGGSAEYPGASGRCDTGT